MSVGFGGSPVTGDHAGEEATPVRPPAGLLWSGLVTCLAGAALLAADDRGPHLVGYVLNSLVTVALVAAFPRVDAHRRRSRYYSPRPALFRVAACLAVVTVAVAGLHAWDIATRLAS